MNVLKILTRILNKMEQPNVFEEEKERILEVMDYLIYITDQDVIKAILKDLEVKVKDLHA